MQLSNNAPTILPKTYEEFKADQAKRAVGNGELGKQDFLNLLIEQMKNQDPLSPMESADFTQQTSSFSQLEQLINMNTTLTSLLESQSVNTNLDNTLINAAAMIGQTIEYNTNTLTITESGDRSNIAFYASAAAANARVNIYNADSQLVGSMEYKDIKKGANAFTWDGKGFGGELPAGIYSFEVAAKDASGGYVTVGTYGEGEVLGVKTSGGQVYFELKNGLVAADTVYSVKNKTATDTGTN